MSAPMNAADAIGLPGCLSARQTIDLAGHIRDGVAAALGRGIDLRRIASSLPRAQIASLAEQQGARPACSRGCAACCHQPVAVSPVEVLDLAGYLRSRRSAAELSALRAALQAQQAQGDTARCALLSPDRTCSVYARRPLTCVGYHSFDAAACADLTGTHPYVAAQEQLAISVQLGIILGCEAAGLEGGALDLARALDRALSDPTLEARWRRGEAVFSGCERVQGPARRPAAPSPLIPLRRRAPESFALAPPAPALPHPPQRPGAAPIPSTRRLL